MEPPRKRTAAEVEETDKNAEAEEWSSYTLIPPEGQNKDRMAAMKKCVFFVQATRDEHQSIFNKWSKNANARSQNAWDKEFKLKLDWTASNEATFFTIGHILGHTRLPVTLNITIETIEDRQVCFYYPSGMYVDYHMIEGWLDKYFISKYDGDRRNRVGYENFHFVADRIIELNKSK
jgi:hypothetical protein